MSERLHRAAWLFLAALFIFTGVGIGAISVWQSIHSDNQTAKQQAQTNPKGTPTVDNKLAGKPLANFAPVAKIDSLQKVDTTPGTGSEAKAGSTVTAHYTGAVAATGTVFQSSYDSGQPIPFSLNQVITGWKEGVPGMKVGGTRRLLIPAVMAYGANPPGGSGIPANADLVFDITLVAVK